MWRVGSLRLRAQIEHWPLVHPFRTATHTWSRLDVLKVALEFNGLVGHGEAAGVFYKKDTPRRMLKEIAACLGQVEKHLTRLELQTLLPPGGARNAIDCAMWDLEAKISRTPAWRIAGLEKSPKPLLTTFTCGVDSPRGMASTALAHQEAKAIKIKIAGDFQDADRVCAVRAARPDVWLSVDGNQCLTTRSALEDLMPTLIGERVSLIEQPFPVGAEELLDGLDLPIPIAADESVQGVDDIASVLGKCQLVNIKLDKCGGLTEALAMVHRCHQCGLGAMVGNMIGTSLAMAPACIVGQGCQVIDLDGPLFLAKDREPSVRYSEGFIQCNTEGWGSPGIA